MNYRNLSAMLAALAMTGTVSASALRIENVRLRDQDRTAATVVVEFDVSWDHAWRTARNHDAAWVVVKFRAPGSNAWQHAWLSTDAGAHAAPDGGVELGTTAVEGTPRGMGAFVYSADPELGTGVSVSYPKTRLIWHYGANGYDFAPGDPVDVSVQAIEMVYVPEGAFFVGTGGTEAGSFTDGGWAGSGAGTLPFAIESEGELAVAPEPGALWGIVTDGSYARIGDTGTLDAAFPKGFGAFYVMKYNVTQGQYVSFLNRLDYAQQASRTPIGVPPDSAPDTYLYNNYRHRIRIATPGVNATTPAVYATTAPHLPCNYLTWADSAAILAWSGLRPMTELEYEKACRGPAAPVPGEYAWGTPQVKTGDNPRYTLDEPDTAEERIATGYLTDGSSGNAHYFSSRIFDAYDPEATGDNLANVGPTRAGIFATADAGRVAAGASYWGVNDLSANLMERVIAVASGRSFAGTHGNGALDASGNPTGLPDWPPSTGVGCGLAGTDFYNQVEPGQVSHRQNRSNHTSGSTHRFGIRGVRSMP